MDVRLVTGSDLPEYARIPIAFTVRTIFDVVPVDSGLGGLSLVERQIETPYVKDYDLEESGGPKGWQDRFDIRNWAIFIAHEDDIDIGGVAFAWNSNDVDLLQGRKDLAVLWDLRVAPDWRRKKVASLLVSAGTDWAKSKGCSEMTAETQNINVPACRFYVSQGFRLFSIDPSAYRDLPNETQLIWHLNLN
jgi:GNAT superfamily N-acetyltransferase